MTLRGRFLVLGACGNVGQWVVRDLARRFPEAEVRASVRPNGMSPPPADWTASPNILPVDVELDDPNSIDAAMKRVERVFFVPQNTPKQLDHDRHVARVVRASDTVEFYVRQSVCSGLSSRPSDCAFSQMHARAEAELAEANIPTAILRPNFAMMNVFFLVVPSLQHGAVQWPWPADLPVAHVDPRDAGAVGALLVGATDPERYRGRGVHVAGPHKWTPSEIVAAVASRCGQSDATYAQVGYDDFRAGLIHGANMAPWMAEAVTEVFRDVERACNDGSMYVDDTGPGDVIDFERDVGRLKHTFSDFLEFFSVADAFHRMRQHSSENRNY